MKFLSVSIVTLACLAGCANAPAPENASSPDVAEGAPAPSASSESGGEATPAANGESGGRVAFENCPEQRSPMCTREYRPVCAEVDTGVRCIQAPCPSSEKKEYSNGCMACADEKVIGYFAGRCADLGGDTSAGAK